MESLVATSCGLNTAACRGIFLHSTHNPAREAERVLAAEGLADGMLLVVLGACLDYLERAALTRYRNVQVAAVYYSEFFFERRQSETAWHPGKNQSIEDFLSLLITERDFSRLKLVDWEPAARAYPDIAQRVREALRQHIRQINGTLLTTQVFGRRWIRNSIRNFLAVDGYLLPAPSQATVCICASGPSLAAFLPAARRHRQALRLWALPSALQALTAADLQPDLIVLSDAGFYSRAHVDAWRRGRVKKWPATTLAMPLSAAGGPWLRDVPVCPIVQDSFIEQELAAHLPLAPPRIPSHGTVAGTALGLALSLGAGRILFAGLDLAVVDGLDHVRPSPFERWFETGAGRTSPLETSGAARLWSLYPSAAGRLRTSPAMETYAGWFRQNALSLAGRVFRFKPLGVEIGLESVDEAFLDGLDRQPDPAARLIPAPALPERRAIVRSVLAAWRVLARAGLPRHAIGANEQAVFDLLLAIETSTVLALSKALQAGKPCDDEMAGLTGRALAFLDGLEAYAG